MENQVMAENNRPEVTFQTLLLNNKNDQKDNKKDLDKIHIIIATITIILSIAFMALAWYFNQTQYKYNYFIMLAVLFYMVNLGLSIYLLLPYNDITVKRKISAFCLYFSHY
jgi:magnesium-transporting ATPase (P-type)